MTQRILGPRYHPPARRLDPSNPHDKLLLAAEGAVAGPNETYATEFEVAVEKIERDETLSDKGKRGKLEALAQQYADHEHVREFNGRWIERAEREAARLQTELIKRPTPELEGLSVPEQTARLVGDELRKNRQVLAYQAASAEKQREIVRGALDKAATAPTARETLTMLLDNNLLDAKLEPRARIALMRGAQPETLRQYEELVGAHSYDGTIDPERPGALVLARLARDNYRRFLRERAGLTLTLDQLSEQYGVPAPQIDAKTIRLSRETASNAVIFRQAQAEAEAKGLEFVVESLEETFGGGGGEAGGNGTGGSDA